MTPTLPPQTDYDLFVWVLILFACGVIGREKNSEYDQFTSGLMGIIAGFIAFDIVNGYFTEYEGIFSAILIGSSLASATVVARAKVVISNLVGGFSTRTGRLGNGRRNGNSQGAGTETGQTD